MRIYVFDMTDFTTTVVTFNEMPKSGNETQSFGDTLARAII
jgi:hypothetical protein